MAGEREALVRRACDTIEPPVELACSYPECRCEKAGTVGRVAVVLVDAGWRPPPESQAAGELPWDRDQLGRFVREAWVRWAQTQPVPKPSWLIPYDDLAEADKEVDRQIGEAIARWTIIGQNAKHAITEPQAAAPEVVMAEVFGPAFIIRRAEAAERARAAVYRNLLIAVKKTQAAEAAVKRLTASVEQAVAALTFRAGLIEALTTGQRQLDQDGVEIAVSREALCGAIEGILNARAALTPAGGDDAKV